jgi:6-phosphogluconolactonase (cycloisomerase 2 family)
MMPATVSTIGLTPQSITVDASDKYVYMANQGSNSVSQYTIGTGGALTPMSSPTAATGTSPYSVTTAVSLH